MDQDRLRQLNTQGLSILPKEHGGLGFLAVAAAAPAAGPAAPIVAGVAIAGSLLTKLFGFGPPSSGTSYRPPANSKDLAVQFPSKGVNIAFDMNDIGQALARGNKEADLRSYYSAFISGSVDAGASDAAKRVIVDAVNKYGVSVRDIAETLLTQAGVRKIVTPIQQPTPAAAPTAPVQAQSFVQTTTQAPVELPKIVPAVLDIFGNILDFLKGKTPPIPAYSSIPVDMSPPAAPAPGQTGQTPAQTNQAQAAAQKALIAAANKAIQALLKAKQKVADQASQFGCDPSAQYYDPATNSCVTLLTCPEGQYFEPSLGTCATPPAEEDLGSFLDSLGNLGGIPVWLLILLAGILITQRGDGGKTVTFRRRS